MGLLDRPLGKPSISTFAAQLIQAFREAGDKSDLRFDPPKTASFAATRIPRAVLGGKDL
jgi:hypothetical protein